MRQARTLKIWNYIKSHYMLYIFLLPAIIYMIIFNYVPLYGAQIAFRDFKPGMGFSEGTFVGLRHFLDFFNSYFFAQTFSNTLILSLSTLIISFPFPLILALLLNQLPGQRYRRLVQTVTYAPYFISMVVVYGIMYVFMAPQTGFISNFLGLFAVNNINLLGDPAAFRPAYILSNIWQTTGWNAIIYLGVLANVSPELHEAAIVDGASKIRRIWHIDIPGILPTVVILFILNAGNIMSIGFEKVYLMQNGSNMAVSEIIATYVYKAGIESQKYSYAAAVGLFNAVINMIVLFVVNLAAKKTTNSSLW